MLQRQSDRELIEGLLKEFGSDTLSYFHLQHDRKYFFSPSGKSFLSYKIFKNVAIVAGDPIGPENEIPLLLESFLQYSSSWNLLPFFLSLSNTYTTFLKNKDMKLMKIGEEAILHLDFFDRHLLKKKVKRAVRHVEESGIEIFFYTASSLPPFIREQIEKISIEWLERKGGKEKGFSMTLKRLPSREDKDCEFAVAIKENEVIGYMYFVPSYASKSMSLDHIRSIIDSPNGLHEFLIVKSAEYFKKNHIKKISLNFATFANMVETSSRFHIRKRVMQLFEQLYKCDTLRSFNNKFYPTWENRYVAFSSLLYLPHYVLAILMAER